MAILPFRPAPSEEVDAVAEGIWRRTTHEGMTEPQKWQTFEDFQKAIWRRYAKAALEAFKEYRASKATDSPAAPSE